MNNAIFSMLKAGFTVLLLYYQVSRYQIPAELSSAQYFTAGSANSGEKGRAVPCGAVPCRAVLRAMLYSIFRFCHVWFDDVSSRLR